MNLRVFFIYICKTAHFGWLLFFNPRKPAANDLMGKKKSAGLHTGNQRISYFMMPKPVGLSFDAYFT